MGMERGEDKRRTKEGWIGQLIGWAKETTDIPLFYFFLKSLFSIATGCPSYY